MVTAQEFEELKNLEIQIAEKEKEVKRLKAEARQLNLRLTDAVLWHGVTQGEIPGLTKFKLKPSIHISIKGGQEALIEMCKKDEQLAGLVKEKVEAKTFDKVMNEELYKTFSLRPELEVYTELKLQLTYPKKKGDTEEEVEG